MEERKAKKNGKKGEVIGSETVFENLRRKTPWILGNSIRKPKINFRLASRRTLLQGLGDDGAGRAARQLRPVQAPDTESDRPAYHRQTGRRAGRPARYAPRGVSRSGTGKRAVRRDRPTAGRDHHSAL